MTWDLPKQEDKLDIEPEFPKDHIPRKVKITYSICGEVEINDMGGDNYVTFRNKEEQDGYDKAHFISWFRNRVKTKGLKGLDFNISIKSKDIDDEMFNEVTNTPHKNEDVLDEPPF